MQYLMDKASHMAGRLKLDERQVNVRPWPQDSQIERLHAALRKYDIDYDESTRDAAGLVKMKKLYKLLKDSDHV